MHVSPTPPLAAPAYGPAEFDTQRALLLKMHYAKLVEGMHRGEVTVDQICTWFWSMSDEDVNLLVRGGRAAGGA